MPAARTPPEAPRRRRLAPEERSAQILDVAARLLLDEGFTEISMERLGREAGVSKPLVYNYFPSRNELLRALLERELAHLHERQRGAVKAARGFQDLVRRTTRLYIDHVAERGTLLRRLWSEAAVARTVAEKDRKSRDEAMRYFARQVSKEYGLPLEVALPAVDMQMAMTETAAQHLADSGLSAEMATEICVTLLLGGMQALAKAYAKQAKTTAPARKRAARRTRVRAEAR